MTKQHKLCSLYLCLLMLFIIEKGLNCSIVKLFLQDLYLIANIPLLNCVFHFQLCSFSLGTRLYTSFCIDWPGYILELLFLHVENYCFCVSQMQYCNMSLIRHLFCMFTVLSCALYVCSLLLGEVYDRNEQRGEYFEIFGFIPTTFFNKIYRKQLF